MLGDHQAGDDVLYSVRLTVPRAGWRASGKVRGDFERQLSSQEGRAVTGEHIDSEIRRGRDYVRVVIVATAEASDIAEALSAAWRAFRKAAGGDLADWDLTGAAAEVEPTAG